VEEVIIRTADREIYFSDASVSKMTARGEVTWQVMGTDKTRPRTDKPAAPAAPSAPVRLEVKEEDVDLVASQANVSKEQARKALEAANGEPAEALMKLLGDDA
jgi:nascent polypeptide-associated complex subunit alpha